MAVEEYGRGNASSNTLILNPQIFRSPVHSIRRLGHAGEYAGLVEEHLCVRTAVGVFDVSHMGEVLVEGSDAGSYLERITCNHLAPLKISQAQYSMFLNPQGGVVDDIIIYKQAADRFFICVNAGNTEKDFQWMLSQRQGNVSVTNLSAEYAQVAIQGPNAEMLLEYLAGLVRCQCSLRDPQSGGRTG